MKVSIIGTVGLPPIYGGFETLVAQMVSHLRGRFDFIVYCSEKSYKTKLADYHGAELIYIPLKANGIQSILYDIISIMHAIRSPDILLILGVPGCTILPLVKLLSKKKIIVNIDGLEWKRDKWNYFARNFLRFSERVAVHYADEVISDNAIIQEYVLSFYGRQSHLIAYGGDHARGNSDIESYRSSYPFLGKPYAFGICRIEPENNVHMILDAFAKTKSMPFVMVGNWNNSDYGRGLKERYGSIENITLIDAIYDQKKLDTLRSNCSCYIHGHSAGGTNPSLVEAMWLGLAVIAYDVAYNRETTSNKALYFNSADDLRRIIRDIDHYDLKPIGDDMHVIADERYCWSKIADQYASLFAERAEEPGIEQP